MVHRMSKEPVVIIGAGPAGLTAAYELLRHGIRAVVLEKGNRVGGLARTEVFKGYCFDMGGHRFFTKIERIRQLWQEMLGKDFLRVSRVSHIYYQGRFFKYPLDFFNTFSNLGLLEVLLIPLSYLRSQVLPYPREETFEQWVSNRFGRRLYKVFFRTYTEKVWGIPCQKIRADWAAQRIKGLSLVAALTSAILGTATARSLIDEFWYPVRGPGMMWERFRDRIEAQGGEIRLHSEVTGLRHQGGCIRSVVCREEGGPIEVPAWQVINTIPLARLVPLLDPAAPEDVIKAAQGLFYRAFIIVILIVDKADLFPDQWIYIHSPEVKVGRIQNFKNWSAAMVPDPQKTSVGMEYFCTEGDAIWRMSDDDLAAMAAGELSLLGLAGAEDVVDHSVVRQPSAYPVYDEDYKQHLEVIQRFLPTIGNLQTIGRNGMHRYNNMDHSMHTGILAAENILGANHDLWKMNDEGEYLEEDKRTMDGKLITEKVLRRAFARMDKLAFATALGSVLGLLTFLATLWLIIKGGEVVGPNLRLLGQYFIGYTVTLKGAFIAFGYSFLWGFLLGWLFAYVRNFFLAYYIYRVKKKAEVLSIKDFLDHF
jgi:protoporphyrinogen oxidase